MKSLCDFLESLAQHRGSQGINLSSLKSIDSKRAILAA